MLRRITTKRDCGQCYRSFKSFETVHYLGIDNNSFCAECREKIALGKPDDPHHMGGWVPTLFVGGYSEARGNILQLIELWNNSLEEDDYVRPIEVTNQSNQANKKSLVSMEESSHGNKWRGYSDPLYKYDCRE